MKVTFGSEILLPTRYGNFDVTHVEVSLDSKTIREGVLLQKKMQNSENIYVRVQSSCLFSESFWTTDCDCSLQLQNALQFVSTHGGYVLYFYEEGRGAGLNIKFQAIKLQQLHKFDTKKAYECLKVNVDERSYDAAAAVLKEVVGEKPIILLTNNPSKVEGLTRNGIKVEERMEWLFGMDSPDVKNYLEEKRESLGHIIPENHAPNSSI